MCSEFIPGRCFWPGEHRKHGRRPSVSGEYRLRRSVLLVLLCQVGQSIKGQFGDTLCSKPCDGEAEVADEVCVTHGVDPVAQCCWHCGYRVGEAFDWGVLGQCCEVDDVGDRLVWVGAGPAARERDGFQRDECRDRCDAYRDSEPVS